MSSPLFDLRIDPTIPKPDLPVYRHDTHCIFLAHEDGYELAGYRYTVIMVPAQGVLLRWQWDHLFEDGPAGPGMG